MGSIFLQESEATVVVFDLRNFSGIAASTPPVQLGMALSRYYGHVEERVRSHGGRLIKFMGDIVMAAWLGPEVGDHRKKALAAVKEAVEQRPSWVQQGIDAGMPPMDYSLAAASGNVLAGQIGTARLNAFDVLGAPASIARKLTPVATSRGVDHLITAETIDPASGIAATEVEGIELGGRKIRLYRLG